MLSNKPDEGRNEDDGNPEIIILERQTENLDNKRLKTEPEVQDTPEIRILKHKTGSADNKRSGDFVIHVADLKMDNPPIWRIIQDKCMLQKYEPFLEENANKTCYRNLSVYTRWTSRDRCNYQEIAVKFIKNCVVEYIHYPLQYLRMQKRVDYNKGPSKESFEVFIQTLLSQSLDVGFLKDVIKDNDEFFLSSLRDIDKGTSQRKSILEQKIKFTPELKNHVDAYSKVTRGSIIAKSSAHCSKCSLCNGVHAIQTLTLSGNIYDFTTLQDKAEQPEITKQDVLACPHCAEQLIAYHKAHHNNFYIYRKCCYKIRELCDATAVPTDPYKILGECLYDINWMNYMYNYVVAVWQACEA